MFYLTDFCKSLIALSNRPIFKRAGWDLFQLGFRYLRAKAEPRNRVPWRVPIPERCLRTNDRLDPKFRRRMQFIDVHVKDGEPVHSLTSRELGSGGATRIGFLGQS
jgi:hypothetical protein